MTSFKLENPGKSRLTHQILTWDGKESVERQAPVRMASFFASRSIVSLQEETDSQLVEEGRIGEPLVKRPGDTHYRAISWEEAFALTGKVLRSLNSPQEVAFFSPGKMGCEAAFLFQWLAREFGSPHLPDPTRSYHSNEASALQASLGVAQVSVSHADFEKADLVLLLGYHDANTPPQLKKMLGMVRKNGGNILQASPLPFSSSGKEAWAKHDKANPIGFMAIQVAANGYFPLLKAILQLLFHKERQRPDAAFDMSFVASHTEGYEAFATHLLQQDFNLLASASGTERAHIQAMAEAIRKANRPIICWTPAISRLSDGLKTVQEIIHLLLVRGALGKEGAGPFPGRGLSKWQGGAALGITESPGENFLKQFQDSTGVKPPRKKGISASGLLDALETSKVNVLISLGGDIASLGDDNDRTTRALQRCTLTVYITPQLHRSIVSPGETSLILPCLSLEEKFFMENKEQYPTRVDSLGMVREYRGMLAPCARQVKSATTILAGLARHILPASKTPWEELGSHYEAVRAILSKAVPSFESIAQGLKVREGFPLAGTFREAVFPTPTGKARFMVNPLKAESLPKGTMQLMYLESLDPILPSLLGWFDRLRGWHPGTRIILMNSRDMEERGLLSKQQVTLTSAIPRYSVFAGGFQVFPYPLVSGTVAAFYQEVADFLTDGRTLPVLIQPNP